MKSFKDMIFKDLYDMPIGQVRTLDKQHNSYKKYVDTTKEFIRMEADINEGFELEFNADYSQLRKRETHH